jgi:pimeloyl-ACP methyl ester carboxylesterase
MLKKVLIVFVILSLISFFGFKSYVNSGVQLPPNSEEIIAEVLEEDTLPELIKGETGFADSEGVKIWYEKMSEVDSAKATVLLVMGHAASALIWTPKFYQAFLDSGYQVIRYDNRGVGESDWMENWDENNPYTLEDMAKDGMAVLDAVGIEKAHIIGASMGGMIAQRMAISHRERALSLTSIMSSGYMYDPEIEPIPEETMSDFIKLVLNYLVFNPDEANRLRFSLCIPEGLKGSGDYSNDYKSICQRTLYELRKRKGYNPTVGDQHTAAIIASGSRYDELGSISVPTLVIHGKSDPLVIFQHAEKYAPMIPNAQTLFIEGMGHDFPSIYMPQIHEAIFENFSQVKFLSSSYLY